MDVLRRGGVVVYPTETLYGLGADATDEAALERLAALKGRDRGKPISVLVASRAMLDEIVAAVPATAERLMSAFWPGALTIAFPARAGLSAVLTGGGATIAARISSHALAQALVEHLGRPLTSTSANPGGSPPPRDVAQARAYFGAAVDLYVDGGRSPGGAGSTVIDCCGEAPVIVRAGSISAARIAAVLGVRLRPR
ncbi:MAG: threonylcarbamoyl-AMP synthase [Deltaproteobacteria bacterium]|nr:threonylcarbamoyl-AMP synthase [Deltaproteobacteria bacterium]